MVNLAFFKKRSGPVKSTGAIISRVVNPNTVYLVKGWNSRGKFFKENMKGSKLLTIKKKRGVKIYDFYKSGGGL